MEDRLIIAIVPVPIRNGRRGGITGYSLPCGGCGHMIVVAARTFRDLRATGRAPFCDPCRHPVSVQITEEHKRYWLERFTQAEIAFMSTCVDQYCERLFGHPVPPSRSSALGELALAASASRRSLQ